MKVRYIGVLYNKSAEPVELAAEYSLNDYNRFTKGSVQQIISFGVSTVAKKLKRPGELVKVVEEGYIIHAYLTSEGVCTFLVCDPEYPDTPAQALIRKISGEFMEKHSVSAISTAKPRSLPYPELKDYIVKYQDPTEADSIMKIQKELDSTKVVLHQTIESLLERGEKIDSLVAKSDNLSAQSKMFYTQAKKQNSCCIVM